jgi:NitT/TauT family transport system substrate-binding protein
MMGLMSAKPGPATDKVLAGIAEGSQDSLDSYKEQLSTTHIYFTPKSAAAMGSSTDLKRIMELVRQFCFSHQLLGEKTKSVDDVAIRFPDGAIQGRNDRVRLRFENAYMQMAAEGKL